MVDALPTWPADRYAQYVARAQDRRGLDGRGRRPPRVATRPAVMTHLFGNYGRVLGCMNRLDAIAPDAPPASPDNFTGCFDGEFPVGAAVVKAQWRRAEFGAKLPTFDTSRRRPRSAAGTRAPTGRRRSTARAATIPAPIASTPCAYQRQRLPTGRAARHHQGAAQVAVGDHVVVARRRRRLRRRSPGRPRGRSDLPPLQDVRRLGARRARPVAAAGADLVHQPVPRARRRQRAHQLHRLPSARRHLAQARDIIADDDPLPGERAHRAARQLPDRLLVGARRARTTSRASSPTRSPTTTRSRSEETMMRILLFVAACVFAGVLIGTGCAVVSARGRQRHAGREDRGDNPLRARRHLRRGRRARARVARQVARRRTSSSTCACGAGTSATLDCATLIATTSADRHLERQRRADRHVDPEFLKPFYGPEWQAEQPTGADDRGRARRHRSHHRHLRRRRRRARSAAAVETDFDVAWDAGHRRQRGRARSSRRRHRASTPPSSRSTRCRSTARRASPSSARSRSSRRPATARTRPTTASTRRRSR